MVVYNMRAFKNWGFSDLILGKITQYDRNLDYFLGNILSQLLAESK